jgi:subtilisin family serine protease
MSSAPRLAVLALVIAATLAPAAPDDGTSGFLPKDDLGVSAFQRERPEADGRGVTVAVLDTGLDLLHPALQRTPDGKAKIIDFHDATNAGEVETIVKATPKDGSLIGLSGRRLRLGPDAPGEVRIGLVRSTVVYPKGLLRRLRRERKEDRAHEQRLACDRAAGGKEPKAPAKKGDPVHDLVLYRLDDGWRAVVDTDQDGDLVEEKTLREYGVAQDVAVLGGRTRLGFGLEVKRDGDAVSLLFDGGGHGTHVAGIIAGYHGEGSPLNGLAPAARLLGVKIGNGRYGGATTHLALIRGLEWAGRKGADVVNISFGGPSLFADGREVSAAFVNDAVAKYGYIVCLSAGNAGPALSTVGSPSTARRAVTVGAWCSASTQSSNYGVVSPRAGALFAFSSRGPLPNGAPGLDFIAPGAAVSSVPEWSLVAGRNMNGTSMAAPQASGAIAALISAALADEVPTSYARLMTALRRGARRVPGLTEVEQGYGLIDVGGAFAALGALAGEPEPVDWIVEGGGHYDRGVIDDAPFAIVMKLKPDFPEDTPAEFRTRFERMLRLETDADWLGVATPTHASGNGASVHAQARPAGMKPGLNVGVIRAYDIATGLEEARLVVTAIRPHVVPRCGAWHRETVELGAGEARSIYLRVPPGATQVRIEMNETAREGGARIAFRSIDSHVRDREGDQPGSAIVPGRTTIRHREVREGTTLEVVLHRRFQATTPVSRVDIGLCFKGLECPERTVLIPRHRLGTHINIRAGGNVRGHFECRVEWLEEPFSLTWNTERDPDAQLLLDEEPIFTHAGAADFDVPSDRAEVRFDLGFETPFDDYLDDATYRIEDMHGKVEARGHIWRGPFSFKAPHRGRYRLRILIWERGRRFFRDGGMFAPVLLRKVRARHLTVRQDIFEGFMPGGPSGRNFSLRDAQRTSALLLRPRGDGAIRGTVRFVDDDWSVALLERPLRVEAPALLGPETEIHAALKALVETELREAMDRDEISEARRASLVRLASIARAAGQLTPAAEAGLHLLEARGGAEQAKGVLPALDFLVEGQKGKPDLDAILRARAEARLVAGETENVKADLDRARGEPEDEIRVRALLAMAEGKAKDALKLIDRWRKTAPPRVSLARARFDLLVAEKRLDEARRVLRGWTDRFPDRTADVAEMALAIEAAATEKAGE